MFRRHHDRGSPCRASCSGKAFSAHWRRVTGAAIRPRALLTPLIHRHRRTGYKPPLPGIESACGEPAAKAFTSKSDPVTPGGEADTALIRAREGVQNDKAARSGNSRRARARARACMRIDDRTLAALAREVEETDPIAWGGLDLDRDAAYRLMASQIAEIFRKYEQTGVGRDEQLLIALSSAVKLSVENFVLHQRLIAATRARQSRE